ncbi:hypothetical protein [Cylindrospermum sp. FACHB-282]|uniref:hypothetical protein n=1 Tax=Cylindrospermum sp. FACHB-282 TaxID=2692794 RepID=UPI001682764E|nr:hypothetical protein [Cylindrospermum sp. FACHB-282]MBD2385080.1 hypothetical protein [Cylindrospermum sp. FACHB-282]
MTLLATVVVSPAAMAQQQSLTTQPGGLEQQVPCTDSRGLPIKCPWEKKKPLGIPTHQPQTTSEISDQKLTSGRPSTGTAAKKRPNGTVILGEPTCTQNGKRIECP